MSAPHINLSFVLSVYQKLSKLVDIWRTCDKKNFAQFFFETRCTVYLPYGCTGCLQSSHWSDLTMHIQRWLCLKKNLACYTQPQTIQMHAW